MSSLKDADQVVGSWVFLAEKCPGITGKILDA